MVKNPSVNEGDTGDLYSILGWEDPPRGGNGPTPAFFAWRIPWTEEPDGLHTRVCEHTHAFACQLIDIFNCCIICKWCVMSGTRS